MSENICDCCGRRNSWGCGHTGRQRWMARRHQQTKAHQTGQCWHYSHADCGPECPLQGTIVIGYAPLVRHIDVKAVELPCTRNFLSKI